METINIAILVTGGVVIGLVAWMIARRMRNKKSKDRYTDVSDESPHDLKYGVPYQLTNIANQIDGKPDDGLNWIGTESNIAGGFYVVNDVSKSAVFEFYDEDGKIPSPSGISCAESTRVTIKVNGKWLCETSKPFPNRENRQFTLVTTECASKAPKMLFHLRWTTCGGNGIMWKEVFGIQNAQSIATSWIPVKVNGKSVVGFCAQSFHGVGAPPCIKDCLFKATEKV